eukprot:COSAG01_NODE_45545_length_408_cov_1.365696_2_plen_44_part_01
MLPAGHDLSHDREEAIEVRAALTVAVRIGGVVCRQAMYMLGVTT